MEAQRIGTLPDDELAKAYDKARKEARLLHYEELIVVARPLWYQLVAAGGGECIGADQGGEVMDVADHLVVTKFLLFVVACAVVAYVVSERT
jgi:hypothetical protein